MKPSKKHAQHVLRKIGVTDRTQAAVWAVLNGVGLAGHQLVFLPEPAAN